MTSIYLAGKISEDPNYKIKFLEKENVLVALGYQQVYNPARIEERAELGWSDYMKIGIENLMKCDEVAFLEDWRESRGAIMEYDIAKRLGIKLKFFNGNTLEDRPQRGIKFDNLKINWSLVDLKLLEGLVRVLMYGEKKYSSHNWQGVENGKERYLSALMRHIVEYQDGKEFDEETGQPVIDSILCNAYFLKYFEENK